MLIFFHLKGQEEQSLETVEVKGKKRKETIIYDNKKLQFIATNVGTTFARLFENKSTNQRYISKIIIPYKNTQSSEEEIWHIKLASNKNNLPDSIIYDKKIVFKTNNKSSKEIVNLEDSNIILPTKGIFIIIEFLGFAQIKQQYQTSNSQLGFLKNNKKGNTWTKQNSNWIKIEKNTIFPKTMIINLGFEYLE